MLKAKFVAVKMDINGTSKKVRVKWRYVSPPVTPPPPHLAEETCWDSLPPEPSKLILYSTIWSAAAADAGSGCAENLVLELELNWKTKTNYGPWL
ncbi:unnamed protein product [Orchesella dallaii]|uniref:Uncharacterized protein n=1 Tax=Orchesella dallaii TaxID=48710 RepID=A0ABP1R1Z3_9HEXA